MRAVAGLAVGVYQYWGSLLWQYRGDHTAQCHCGSSSRPRQHLDLCEQLSHTEEKEKRYIRRGEGCFGGGEVSNMSMMPLSI